MDVTTQTVEDQIVKQVEFYFSNSNLPNDHFLRNLYTADTEHGVDISTIATFKRMKMLTEDVELVKNALRKHCALPESKIILTTNDTKVTRKEPLPEFVSTAKQSIVVEKLPLTTNIDEIETFINTQLPSDADGKVKCVRLHRNTEKEFDGIAFVELTSEKDAEALAAKGQLVWAEIKTKDDGVSNVELSVCTRPAYVQRVRAEDQRRGTKRKNEDAAEKDAKIVKTEGADDNGDALANVADEESEEEMPEIIPDLLVKFDTVGAESTRESLRAYIVAVGGDVGYVDFSKGETEAVVRLVPESVAKAHECVERILSQKPELDGTVPLVRLFSPEEETAYMEAVHKRMIQKKKDRAEQDKSRRSGRSGGNRRGGGRGRGRGRGRGGRGRGNFKRRN